MLIDSHCHLHLMKEKDPTLDFTNVFDNAKANDVQYMLCVGTDLKDIQEILRITKMYPHVFGSLGLHPTESIEVEPSVETLVNLASLSSIIAIGETGLDYYREESDIEKQIARFRTHIRAAKILKKPLIIHTRAAQKDTIQILKEEGAEEIGGVMHCFTESFDMAKEALDLNFYISFSGIITFKTAEDLRGVVKRVPMDRLLVETDAPYLAPVPFRGQMNQPSYVKYVAEHVAELKKMEFLSICETTSQNFFELFKIQAPNLL